MLGCVYTGMKEFFSQIQIQVNDRVYLKDPNSSELGKKIVSQGLLMIDEMGLEGFTFRKLAKQLATTESSVYRYFESKHKLLIYLTSWYWGWLEYQLVFSTANLASPHDRLTVAIQVLCGESSGETEVEQMDMQALNRIVISESSKAYLTKQVDDGNRIGLYTGYKRLVKRISEIIHEINPSFPFAHTLVSTIVEGIHHQKYFAEHLPSLTDIIDNPNKLASFYGQLAMSIIQKNN